MLNPIPNDVLFTQNRGDGGRGSQSLDFSKFKYAKIFATFLNPNAFQEN